MHGKAATRVARQFKVGDTIGGFTIVDGPFPHEKEGMTGWVVQHTCGATIRRTSHLLRYHKHTFCAGCMKKHGNTTVRTAEQCAAIGDRSRKHGLSRTPEFRIWATMLSRCRNPNVEKYAEYGGRGIRVCDAWTESFEAFYRDVGPRPSPRHSLDRLENSGHYEPGNVAWRTAKQQARNRRSTFMVQTPTGLRALADLAEEAGLPIALVRERIRRFGWTLERALNTPAGTRGWKPDPESYGDT